MTMNASQFDVRAIAAGEKERASKLLNSESLKLHISLTLDRASMPIAATAAIPSKCPRRFACVFLRSYQKNRLWVTVLALRYREGDSRKQVTK
jgi:hypothetical protein